MIVIYEIYEGKSSFKAVHRHIPNSHSTHGCVSVPSVPTDDLISSLADTKYAEYLGAHASLSGVVIGSLPFAAIVSAGKK